MKKEIYNKVQKYCEKNLCDIYIDYQEELGSKQCQDILENPEMAKDTMYEVLIQGVYDYFSENTDIHFHTMLDELGVGDIDQDRHTLLYETVKSAYSESVIFDTEQAIKDLCRNTSRVKVVAIPFKQSGNPVEFPHSDFDEPYNRRIAYWLKDKLGIKNPLCAETCYSVDILKVMGTLDWWEILKKGTAPTHIIFSDKDTLTTHNGWNGSGGCGDIPVKKQVCMRALFKIDELSLYGVQKTFGFANSCWQNELLVITKKTQLHNFNY